MSLTMSNSIALTHDSLLNILQRGVFPASGYTYGSTSSIILSVDEDGGYIHIRQYDIINDDMNDDSITNNVVVRDNVQQI